MEQISSVHSPIPISQSRCFRYRQGCRFLWRCSCDSLELFGPVYNTVIFLPIATVDNRLQIVLQPSLAHDVPISAISFNAPDAQMKMA